MGRFMAGRGSRRLLAVVAVLGAGLVGAQPFPANAAFVGGGVSVNDPSANEGDGTGGELRFTVTASGLYVAPPTTVFYTTVDGTAKAGQDYTARSGTLTFSDTGTQEVVVPILGDTALEPNETVVLELRQDNAQGAVIDSGTGTITNDDFSLSVADRAVTEGNSGTANAGVLISLSGARSVPTTVQYATVDGTAIAPNDYTTTSASTATIAAGQTSVTVNIPIVGDALYEDDETFLVTLSNPSGGVVIGDGTATVTINDNDPIPDPGQQPKVSIGDVSLDEGNSGTATATFPLALSSPAPYTVSVAVATSDGVAPFPKGGSATAPDDYVAIPGDTRVTFAPGQTAATLAVTVKGDTLFEFDEQFLVTISNPTPGAQVDESNKAGVGTVLNEDAAPTISVGPASADEGSDVRFTVTLSSPAGTDLTIALRTADNTATAPADYTALPGTTRQEIEAGETSTTVDVAAKVDQVDEASESFTLFAARQAAPGAATFAAEVAAVGTINDGTAAPSFAVGNVSKNEGNAGTTAFDFAVSLSAASAQVTSVSYTVGPDPGAGAAVPGVDFAPATGTLTFAAGETTKTLSVAVTGDTTPEADEPFRVSLSGPQNATVADALGIGTIQNDDGTFVGAGVITTGAGVGGGAHVRFYDNDGVADGPGFFGTVNGPGVRVARGDLDGDGGDEVIVSSGPGGPSLVRVFTGDGSALIAEINAYPGFSGGVSIAAGDVDNDGKDEIVTGAGPGGGPHVRTFDLTGEPGARQLVGTDGFFGLDASNGYTGGVNVAAGDTDGQGADEIITSVASNGPPVVGVFDFNGSTSTATRVRFFLAFDQGFRGGVSIAAGDVLGDAKAEIVVGAGPGGAPHVRVLSETGGGYPGSAYAYGANFPGGVQVAVGDVDGDGDNDIVTGVGAGGSPHVRAFDFDMKPLPTSFYAYDQNFQGGVFVAVSST